MHLTKMGKVPLLIFKRDFSHPAGCGSSTSSIHFRSCLFYVILHYYIYIYIYIYILLIITGVQASGVIIDRLLRQCCFVWSEIVGPHSSGNFND